MRNTDPSVTFTGIAGHVAGISGHVHRNTHRGHPLRSRPHPLLTATSLLVVGLAVLLPYTPLGRYFGFTPPPLAFYGVLTVMVLVYLLLVEAIKRRFYKAGTPRRSPHA